MIRRFIPFALLIAAPALAEPVRLEAILAPVKEDSLPFEDGSSHIIRLVQRSGTLANGGPFGGASLTEWALHDLNPKAGQGSGIGYLVLVTSQGDKAYLKFDWRAIVAGGTQQLLAGSWQVSGGTGRFAGMTGIGTLRIDVLGGGKRNWHLDGDIFPRP